MTARAFTQDELIAEAFKTEEINVASLNVFLTEEEERRARNANLKRETITGPLLRFYSRGEKVKVQMIVEVEIPGPSSGYKRPYVTGPPLSNPNSGRPAANAVASTSSPYYSSPLANTPTSFSSPAGPVNKGPTSANPYSSSSSPYYHPLPAPPSRSGNGTAPQPAKYVSQSKNYVILDTPGAKPSEDYQYVFGDHVDWGSLKVLPKNRPSSKYLLPSVSSVADFVSLSSQTNPLSRHRSSCALPTPRNRHPLRQPPRI